MADPDFNSSNQAGGDALFVGDTVISSVPTQSPTVMLAPQDPSIPCSSGRSFLAALPNELLAEIARACHALKDYGTGTSNIKGRAFEFSLVNHRFRVVAFDVIFFRVHLATTDEAIKRELAPIINNRFIMQAARHFKITVDVSREDIDVMEDVSHLFTQMLERVPELQALRMFLPEPLRIEYSFGETGPRFSPKIETLFWTLGKQFQGDVSSVASRDLNAISIDIPNYVGGGLNSDVLITPYASSLRKLQFHLSGWSYSDIEDLAVNAGQVEYLFLAGTLGGTTVSSLISVFKRFEHLTHLALTEDQATCPEEFPPDDAFGNAYTGWMLSKAAARCYYEDLAENALDLFKTCPALRSVWLARDGYARRYVPIVSPDGDGTRRVVGARVVSSTEEEMVEYREVVDWPDIVAEFDDPPRSDVIPEQSDSDIDLDDDFDANSTDYNILFQYISHSHTDMGFVYNLS